MEKNYFSHAPTQVREVSFSRWLF